MPLVLAELATIYRMRAEHANSSADAQTALSIQNRALEGTHDGQRTRSSVLLGMAQIYLCRALPGRDVKAAIGFYIKAIMYGYSSAQERLADGLDVLRALHDAVGKEPPQDDAQMQLLEAYRLTVNLFPQIVYFGLDIQARLNSLAQAPSLAADAAAYALHLSKPEAALEILEEGRAVFWMQYSRLRSSFVQLPSDLANELTKTAQDLEIGSRQLMVPSRANVDEVLLHEGQAEQRRRLGERFEHLLAQARALPGLDRFMLSSTFSVLAMAARSAPVVVLVANSDFCGAVLLRNPESRPEQLRFGDIQAQAKGLYQLGQSIHRSRQTTRGLLRNRAMVRLVPHKQDPSTVPLNKIWREIMAVITKTLNLKVNLIVNVGASINLFFRKLLDAIDQDSSYAPLVHSPTYHCMLLTHELKAAGTTLFLRTRRLSGFCSSRATRSLQ